MSDTPQPADAEQAIRDWLQSQPASLRIPADVEQRVADVLAQESASRRRAVSLESAETTQRSPWATRLLVAASVVAATAAVATIAVGIAGRQPDTVASGDAAAESLGRVESPQAAAGSQAEDAAPAPVLEEVPGDLLALASEPGATAGPAGCGTLLAQQVGADLRRSLDAGDAGGVLVVLVDAGQESVWWLPSCESSLDQAYARSTVR